MTCGECRSAFELSARNAREHRRRGITPRCRECRRPDAIVRVTPALRRWWLDRYSLDEIREMAAELEM